MAARKLTEAELAGLDLFIAKKRENSAFIDDIVNVAQAVVVVAAAVDVVTAVAGGAVFELTTDPSTKDKLRNRLSLEELIDLRKRGHSS